MNKTDTNTREGLSLGKVARHCGVTRKTILRWVNENLLQSFALPSGHHRVPREEVVRFLREHDMPVPEELDVKRTKSVLIVDDDANIRRILVDLFKGHFDVSETANGIEACLAIGAKRPDLLMIDYRMPHMDGLEVIRQIRRNPKLRDMKIIVISAHIEQREQLAFGGLADAIIHKPFKPRQVVEEALSLVASD